MAANIIVINGTTIAGSTITAASDVLSVTSASTIDALAGAVVNAGGLDVLAPNVPLGMVGTIDNSDAIIVEAANTLTVNLVLLSTTISGHVHFFPVPGTITLTGGGEVIMFGADVGVDSLAPYATLEAALGASGFENVDNTLWLNDALVKDDVGLTNDLAGTIDAGENYVDVYGHDTPIVNHGTINAYGTLNLGDTVINNGLIEAEQLTPYLGTIDLSGDVANTGGTLAAVSGATLLLDLAAIHGGTVEAIGGGVVEVVTGVASTLDGSTGTVTLLGSIAVDARLQVDGTIDNTGAIHVASGGILYADAGAVLLGAGSVTLVAGAIVGVAPTDTLENLDNLITGSGTLAGLALHNDAAGSIVATGGALTLDATAAPAVNLGLLDAQAGTLVLTGAVSNASTIRADTGEIHLANATIQGGTLTATGVSTVDAAGLVTLDGSAAPLTTTVDMALDDGATLWLQGTITNAGLIRLGGGGSTSELITAVGGLRLQGNGIVELAGSGAWVAQAGIDNLANVVVGSGELIGASTFTNEAGGAVVSAGGSLAVGFANTVNRGLIEALNGTLALSGNVNNTGGTLAAAGANLVYSGFTLSDGTLTSSAGHAVEIAHKGTLDGSSTMLNTGALQIDAGVTVSLLGTLANAGTVHVLAGGKLLASPGAIVLPIAPAGVIAAVADPGDVAVSGTRGLIQNDGTLAVGVGVTLAVGETLAGTGAVDLADTAALSLAGPVEAGQSVAFAGSGGLSLADPEEFAGTIYGLSPLTTIDLPGIAAGAGISLLPGNTLEITPTGGNAFDLHLDRTQLFAHGVATSGNASGGISIAAACFAPGTSILTATGEKPVEALRRGDRVATVRGRGLRQVHWIGHRRLRNAAPIRITAGAFGEAVPHRDMLLSPDHAVFIDGTLIPVRYLVNGSTIREQAVAEITYFHVELAHHDVLLAEGLPCESYLDTGNRAAFDNGVFARAWQFA